jgi:hypothetical protein
LRRRALLQKERAAQEAKVRVVEVEPPLEPKDNGVSGNSRLATHGIQTQEKEALKARPWWEFAESQKGCP